jgi:hypothetical protein
MSGNHQGRSGIDPLYKIGFMKERHNILVIGWLQKVVAVPPKEPVVNTGQGHPANFE